MTNNNVTVPVVEVLKNSITILSPMFDTVFIADQGMLIMETYFGVVCLSHKDTSLMISALTSWLDTGEL